jgi:hypothetical protein
MIAKFNLVDGIRHSSPIGQTKTWTKSPYHCSKLFSFYNLPYWFIGFVINDEQRAEADRVTILSGVEHGITLGTPIGLFVPNEDQKPSDYKCNQISIKLTSKPCLKSLDHLMQITLIKSSIK